MSSSSSSPLHSFSSLRDMLKPPPYKKPKSSFSSSSSSSSSSLSSTPLSEPNIEENYDPFVGLLDNLSVKESSGNYSSFLECFTPPVLSAASSSVEINPNINGVEKNPNPLETMEKKSYYPNGKTWCVKAGGPWKSNKPFPPPITCLKSIKNGKLFAYMKFNEDDKLVVEEVKIPNRDLLRSSRAGERLKLHLVLSDDDDDDDDDASEIEVDEFEIVKADTEEEEEEEEDSN